MVLRVFLAGWILFSAMFPAFSSSSAPALSPSGAMLYISFFTLSHVFVPLSSAILYNKKRLSFADNLYSLYINLLLY